MKPLRVLIVTEVVTMSVPLSYYKAHCLPSGLSFIFHLNVCSVTDFTFHSDSTNCAAPLLAHHYLTDLSLMSKILPQSKACHL